MEFSRIENPFMNTEESCNIDPVNSFEKQEKLLYLQKCLKKNKICHSLLTELKSSINMLLDKCISEQQIVNANIDLCLRKKVTPQKPLNRCMKRVLCAPYFKDDKNISSPFNEDVSIRNVQGFLNPYEVKMYQEWSERQKSALVKFIRKVEEEKWTETLKSYGMLHLAKVKEMKLEELIESRYDEYDWLDISVSCLNYAHSPQECRYFWFLCLHPNINNEKWSEEENKKLKKLVLKYEGQDWEKIVRELGTKRSMFLSFVHFQQHLKEVKKCTWSEKEMDVLKYNVKLFTCKGYKQWLKLKHFMDGISTVEILKKWNTINRPRGSTFSLEEDIILLAGMRTFGGKYSQIAQYIPDRTDSQVARRCSVLKQRQFPKQKWSAEEDALLINLVQKYGFGNWIKISMHFVNRSRVSVRTRYCTLTQSKANNTLPRSIYRNIIRPSNPVNIPLLWESVVQICKENNISINNLNGSCVNIVHELSDILKSQMCYNKTIPERRFKPFSDSEYNKFFLGAFMLHENEQNGTEEIREIVHAFVQDVVIVLKLLNAKVNLPVSKELMKDSTISCQDKFIINYLIKKIESKNDGSCDVFLPLNSSNKTLVADEDAGVKLDNSHYLFPPNFSTLLAMRSLFLNTKNQEEQKEGLTMQVDNFELKQMYPYFPRRDNYSENQTNCSKLWVQRVDLLLSGAAVMLKEKKWND
ncbi:hypothetical protein R5R35_013928 [Gryllus longicercus]|uniref:snRNA-activating protein complex subunit 4 n=1 Tax=Gryllus longicercus TaxID=2509291 RepID=A0AAN9YWK9_9ORTH